MEKFKKVMWIITAIILVVLIGGVIFGYYKKLTMEVKNPIAEIEVENFGTIKMELYPEKAPESVANFINLANREFYNGTKFHRIVKDFMIQTGSKDGEGKENAKLNNLKEGGEEKEYTIKGEFLANKVENDIKFEEGIVGVARSDYMQYSPDLKEESYNSGCSQFFIMTKENKGLNGLYAPFGKVIEGMDVVHKIENVEVKLPDDSEQTGNTEQSQPVNPPVIKSIKVETHGVEYKLPKTYEPFDVMSWFYQNYNMGQQ